VPVPFGVDARHLTAEEFAVGGGVFELIDSDIVMNHLMKDGILDEFFRQVKTGVDAERETVVRPRAEEPFAVLDKSDLAEKRAGVGQLNGDGRKGTAEETGVVLVEAGLYVGDGRFQVTGCGLWVMGYGLRVAGYGLWG